MGDDIITDIIQAMWEHIAGIRAAAEQCDVDAVHLSVDRLAAELEDLTGVIG